jgi:hypothetical protein
MYREGPYTKGILRKSANSVKCKEIHDKLDDGEDCLDDNIQTLVVGAVLKVGRLKYSGRLASRHFFYKMTINLELMFSANLFFHHCKMMFLISL